MEVSLGLFQCKAEADAALDNINLNIGDYVRFTVLCDDNGESREYRLMLAQSFEVSKEEYEQRRARGDFANKGW